MLHSMEISDEEKKEMAEPSIVEGMNKYPYGLRLCLNHKVLKKMGMTKAPGINTKLKLDALVEVIEVSSETKKGDVPEYRIELQITDLGLSEKVEAKENNADAFYGSANGVE